MHMNKINRTSVGAALSCPPPIYRPHCHPERSEGSLALGRELLPCSFVPLKDKAQHDRAVTPTGVQSIL